MSNLVSPTPAQYLSELYRIVRVVNCSSGRRGFTNSQLIMGAGGH